MSISDSMIPENRLGIIRAFVVEECLHGAEEELDDDMDLIELGVLDSMNMVRLFDFLESRFQVVVPDSVMLESERFATMRLMDAFVAEHRKPDPGA